MSDVSAPSAAPPPPVGKTNATLNPGTADLLLVVLLGVFWGSAFPVIRAGIVAGAPPLLFASVRYLLTALALVPIALLLKAPRPTRTELLPAVAFGGLLMIAGYGALLYIGEASVSGGFAAVLTASAPLASALIGYRLLPSERFGGPGVAGLLIGFAGVAVLALPGAATPAGRGLIGPLLVFAAVMAFASGSVLLRRTTSSATTFWTLSVQFAVAGVAVGLLGVGSGESLTLGAPMTAATTLAFLVVVPGVVGYSLYFRIHHSSGPTRANLVGYVNPVTGLLVGLLIFGEAVTEVELAGLALIALGLFLLQRDRRRSPPTQGAGPSVPPPPPEATRVRPS